jgi:hypothetical protein
MTTEYQEAVSEVMQVYMKRANGQTITAKKIRHIGVLFEYLLTVEVKPLLSGWCGRFNGVRNILLAKIHEYKADAYLLSHAEEEGRFIGVLDELFAYMVGDDTVGRPEGVREKEYECGCGICVETAEALRAALAKAAEIYANQSCEVSSEVVSAPSAPKIKVKVLPRRSARLMAR